jgi:hypothetical protein
LAANCRRRSTGRECGRWEVRRVRRAGGGAVVSSRWIGRAGWGMVVVWCGVRGLRVVLVAVFYYVCVCVYDAGGGWIWYE